MADFDLDEFLAGVVADYRAETNPRINPAGTGVAIATARRRRRMQTTAMSVIVAALVITPIAAYVATHHDLGHAPPPVAVSPTAGPSADPSISPTVDDLADSTLDLPGIAGGPCPVGRTKFTNATAGPYTSINAEALGDFDHDGQVDVVAMINCAVDGNPYNRIVAFHVNSDRTVATIGLVIAPSFDPGFDDGIRHVTAFGASVGGSIVVTVDDFADGSVEGVSQDRVYGWTGRAFEQIAGPTMFHPQPSHLTVEWSPIHFAKPLDGVRVGTVTAVIHNNGTAALHHVSALLLPVSGQLVMAAGCSYVDDIAEMCGDVSIGAGKSVTIKLYLRMNESEAAADIAGGGLNDSENAYASFVQIRVNGLTAEAKTGLGKAVFD